MKKNMLKIEIYVDTVSNETLKRNISYFNGKISSEWYTLDGKYHRKDGPALIWYRKSGKIESKYYYLNNYECNIIQEMVIRGLEAEKLEREAT